MFRPDTDELLQFKAALIEEFEEFLEERGIDIPNEDKIQSESPSTIYGTDFVDLGNRIDSVLEGYGLIQHEERAVTPNEVQNRISELMKQEGLTYTPEGVYMDFPATNPNGTVYQGPGSVKLSLRPVDHDLAASPIADASVFVIAADYFDPAVTADALSQQFSMGIPSDIARKFDEKLSDVADKLAEEFNLTRSDVRGLDINVELFLNRNNLHPVLPMDWDHKTTFRDLVDCKDKYDLGKFAPGTTLEQKAAFQRPVWASLQARIERENEQTKGPSIADIKKQHDLTVSRNDRNKSIGQHKDI